MNDRELVCPRCGGAMRTYQRAGVEVDQCENCRGIFLDRGELEQLANAESTFYQQPVAQPPGYPPPGYDQGQGYPPAGYDPQYSGHHESGHHGGHHGGGHHSGRRRSFLHDLFE